MPTFDDLPKAYDASHVEDSIYAAWEKSGVFNPDKLPERNQAGEPYSIVMPPPNRTGTLHMGHATMLAIEDLLIRFKRMQGKRALWIPGSDHAAIATQVKVEQLLIKDGMKDPRAELGREKFLEKVVEFAEESKNIINNQVRKMGSSCDWSRERYTLDEPRGLAVNAVFKMMFEDGIIERGDRIVNWDPKNKTVISDDEIVYKEEKAPFYTFKYGPFEIGTSRPETKFGDKYVVMHPEDPRYADFKEGQQIELEWINGPIKATVIKDAVIDRAFGTGVMTITPWHDNVDYDLAERRGLEKEQVIDMDGNLLPIAGEFAGMPIEEARKKVVEKLKAKGLLVKVDENYIHRIATAERGGATIEPQISRQWFIRVNKKFALRQDTLNKWKKGEQATLKELMIHAVESGLTTIVPDRFDKTYFHWINNLRDWCISRQIWFGHRIPVWYRTEPCHSREGGKPGSKDQSSNDVICSATSPGEGWTQDPDSLDTWFSSGLWTFSTLGWPLTKLVFFRHGKARSNVELFVDGGGKGDGNSLTDEGIEQVKQSVKELRAMGATRIVSSPVHRTRQTAELIAAELGIPVTFDERLHELGLGKHDGATEEQFGAARGPMDAWRSGAEMRDEIETYASVSERMQAVTRDIVREHAGETVIVVSHGDPLAVYFETHGVENAWKENYPHHATPRVITLDSAANISTDLELYHPTNVLETGYDILFFWVARMILMSSYVLGEVPFKDVYLHGLVRDEEGRKMSKSLGNILDPLDLIPKYGTDAVRLSLVMGTTPGQDVKLSESKIEGFRNFTNKLWNISRFVLMQIGEASSSSVVEPKTTTDHWILARLDDVISSVTKKIETYQLSAAAEELRDFTWNDFADWYLEIAKIEKDKETILARILKSVLAMWHPFMPFVTEYVWGLSGFSTALIVSEWPRPFAPSVEGQGRAPLSFMHIRQLITDMRRLRAEKGVEAAKMVEFALVASAELRATVEQNLAVVKTLARVETLSFVDEIPEGWVTLMSEGVSIGLNVAGTIDVAKEKEKISKEIVETQAYVVSMEQKLSNVDFTSKAPPKVVQAMELKRDEAARKIVALTERLKSL